MELAFRAARDAQVATTACWNRGSIWAEKLDTDSVPKAPDGSCWLDEVPSERPKAEVPRMKGQERVVFMCPSFALRGGLRVSTACVLP